MNLFKPQKPYRFYPPKYRAYLAPLLGALSRHMMMRRQFNVRRVQVDGLDAVARLAADGQSLLLAPNHADHADPHVLLYAGRQRNMAFHFMAAREGFEKSRLAAFTLQRMGAFSVDREGADIAAIKTAMQIVEQGVHPLVIFPEGEIYHHHERLDDLNEGVATILLRASAKVPEGRRCYVVPTAIRYAYDARVPETFSERLDRLESRIGWKPRPELDTVERIYRLGRGLLALKEEEFLGGAHTGELVQRITTLQSELVAMIEAQHEIDPGTGTIPARIRKLRGHIRKQLAETGDTVAPKRERELYDHLDTAFVAAQLYSYPGRYLREQPTPNRIAETLLKLEEDVLGEGSYPVPQDAALRFGEPIDVATFLAERDLTIKTAVRPVTEHLSNRIQSMLDDR